MYGPTLLEERATVRTCANKAPDAHPGPVRHVRESETMVRYRVHKLAEVDAGTGFNRLSRLVDDNAMVVEACANDESIVTTGAS